MLWVSADDKTLSSPSRVRWSSAVDDAVELACTGHKNEREVAMALKIQELKDALARKTDAYDGVYQDACTCLLYTSPSPRDRTRSRMPSSA